MLSAIIYAVRLFLLALVITICIMAMLYNMITRKAVPTWAGISWCFLGVLNIIVWYIPIH
jgi:hypothetical protein